MLPFLTKNIFNPVYVVEYYDGVWTDASAIVHDAPIDLAMPPDFGAAATATATVTMELAPFDWRGMPFRISIGYEGETPIPRFVGRPASFHRRAEGSGLIVSNGVTVTTFGLAGINEIIASKKLWSPLFEFKPIATRTTFDSNDDPSAPDYDAGIINWILWQCGGRPREQEVDYPDALFYYRCDHGPIAPELYWLAGENSLNEIEWLCYGGGGRFYQDGEGVAVYESPYRQSTAPKVNFTDQSLTYAERVATEAVLYDSLEERASEEETVTKIICQYTNRYIAPSETIYDKAYDYNLFGDKDFTLEMQSPFYGDPVISVDAGVIRTGRLADSDDYTLTILEQSASRIVINIANELSDPLMIYTIRVAARPVVAGEQGTAEYGDSDGNVLTVPDNPAIQSEEHAYRLCRMLYDYYKERSTYTIIGTAVNPELSPGDYATLEYTPSQWQLNTPVDVQILTMRLASDGFMDVDARRADYVPQASAFFRVGYTYTDEELMLGY